MINKLDGDMAKVIDSVLLNVMVGCKNHFSRKAARHHAKSNLIEKVVIALTSLAPFRASSADLARDYLFIVQTPKVSISHSTSADASSCCLI